MLSILHIGLPLAPPWLTPKEAEEITVRLAGVRERMDAAGYRYVVAHASPDEDLLPFREVLRTQAWDAVLIGGGVVNNPALAVFRRTLETAVKEERPEAKLLAYDHAVDVRTLVEHALGSER